MQQPPPLPPHAAYSPQANDSRAIVSLVLGTMSLVTCGLTGIPAIAIGISARSAIARSGGTLRGAGIAIAGIATGVAGTMMSIIGIAAFVAGMFVTSRAATTRLRPLFTPSPESTTAWAPAAPAMPGEPMTIGAIHVMDLDPNARAGFHQQLAGEIRRAASAHQTVVVMTTAAWCGVCKEIQASLPDARMQAALQNVDLVRVDVDDFDDELREAGMLEETLPWFYKVDASLHPVDAISAGEWDDNVPQNMAPILKSFVDGTLTTRREPLSTPGGTLL
jgi:thiol:disulfide interchange protein